MKKIKSITILAAILATSSPAFADTITVLNFANNSAPDLAERFEKETGHKIELVTTSNNEEAIGRLMASNGTGYDVVFLSTYAGEPLINMGMLAKINFDNIPNIKNIVPEARKLPGHEYAVPYAWGVGGICYREDLVEKAPDSWWDLLKPSDSMLRKFTMVQTERQLLMPALLVLGYSMNDADPAHLEEAKKLLLEVKPKLLAYDDITMSSRLVSGETAMAQTWDGWCNSGTAENDKIKFAVPKEGADFFADMMYIPAASEQKEAAESFINFVLKPEIHSWVTTELFYKVPNQQAMDIVPKELIEKYPNIGMSPAEFSKNEMLHDLGDQQPLITRIVTEILSSQ